MSERIAATRACSGSSCSRSVVGSSRRMRSAPMVEVARAPTSSSTRGNSMTRSACAFMAACGPERAAYLKSLALCARSCSMRTTTNGLLGSRNLAQLLFRNGADRAAFRATLELRHHATHDRSDVPRAPLDCGAHRGAELVIAHRRWEIGGQHVDFYALLV